MKRFISKMLLLMPILLLMAMVNYTIDSAHLFSGDAFVQALTNNLSMGKNICDFNPNYDERLLEKLMVETFTLPKNIIVFGSSRCKGIRVEMFPGKTFRNAGVSAGTLEDYLGIYQLYYDKNILPETIIVELSPWILNANYEEIRPEVKTLELQYQRIRKRMELDSDGDVSLSNFLWIEKYKELLSPAYLQHSLQPSKMLQRYGSRVLRVLRGTTNEGKEKKISRSEIHNSLSIADEDVPGCFVLYADGSWLSSEEFHIVTRAEALSHVANPKGLQRFLKLHPDRVNLFEKFVDLMRSDGVEVVFYLPPYHPVTYEGLVASPKYRIVKVEEEYFRDFAKRRNIDVYGSYNPLISGCVDDDFADCVHLRRSATPKIFSRITDQLLVVKKSTQ